MAENDNWPLTDTFISCLLNRVINRLLPCAHSFPVSWVTFPLSWTLRLSIAASTSVTSTAICQFCLSHSTLLYQKTMLPLLCSEKHLYMQTSSLKSSFTLSRMCQLLPFSSNMPVFSELNDKLALDLENLPIFYYSFLSLTKFQKNFWAIPSIIHFLHNLWSIQIMVFILLASISMLCLEWHVALISSAYQFFQVLSNESPPLWSPHLCNFFWIPPKNIVCTFLTANL